MMRQTVRFNAPPEEEHKRVERKGNADAEDSADEVPEDPQD